MSKGASNTMTVGITKPITTW